MAEYGLLGVESRKLPDAVTIFFKGIEVVRPDRVFFRDTKSCTVTEGQNPFLFLK
jgi:hypothetical protein